MKSSQFLSYRHESIGNIQIEHILMNIIPFKNIPDIYIYIGCMFYLLQAAYLQINFTQSIYHSDFIFQ